MNKLYMKRIFLFMLILSLAVGSTHAQAFKKNTSRKVERQLFGRTSGKKKVVKIREPRSVVKAKKKQANKEKKLKREYAKSVKRSQKRSVEIQTPEVQARMKQDKKDTAARNKAKKKKVKEGNKKAARKYR